MGRKHVAYEGLRYLLDKKVDIVDIVTDGIGWLSKEICNIPMVNDEHLYNSIKWLPSKYKDIDLVISFLHPKRILKPLIDLPKIGCINFHPAPLPEYRGFAPYSFGVYDCTPTWGVTCHFVDESFDTGDIIKQNRFDINPMEETAKSLQQKSHNKALELFKEVIDEVLEAGNLKGAAQKEGRDHSKEEFESLRRIKIDDSADEIDKKIRAFWCPPFQGAYVFKNNEKYTLVSDKILKGL
jgi:methionyl-tRNA formyltransferase